MRRRGRQFLSAALVALVAGWAHHASAVSFTCGDGIRNPATEECDDGNLDDGDGCDSNCTVTRCGNGIVSNGEQCDDGNTNPSDGCTDRCTICGNGIVATTGFPAFTRLEECDDGNLINDDACDANCTVTRCGNGIVNAGEQCDDGNTNPFDGCTNTCTICGDRIVTPPEECDGNTGLADGCTTACTLCGNDIVTSPEVCDDGNLIDGDGCEASCARLGGAFTVTKTADTEDGVCDSDCSLREAIIAANHLPGADTISIPAGTYELTKDIDILDHLTITGAGADTTVIAQRALRSAADVRLLGLTVHATAISNSGRLALADCTLNDGRITNQTGGTLALEHSVLSRTEIINNGNATFTACTLTAGRIANTGVAKLADCTLSNAATAIQNTGVATLTNCTLSHNDYAIINGSGTSGGITTYGTLILTDCTLSDNASPNGGAINNSTGGTLELINCTLSGNSATECCGGAIYNVGVATLTNCTLSGNAARFVGGAIYNYAGGTLTLTNCTLSGNRAENTENVYVDGGGIYNAGMTTVYNTIIANSPQGGACAILSGFDSPPALPLTSGGYNLDDDGSCGFSAPGDLPLIPAQLEPLGSSGGPVQTHALCTGPGMPDAACTDRSPAIDAGDDALCPATDQRGAPRAGVCDIGAYESGSAPPPETCRGDCNASSRVTTDELTTLVSIALGNTQHSACPHGVPSDVDVTVIMQAVNGALNSCGSGQ